MDDPITHEQIQAVVDSISMAYWHMGFGEFAKRLGVQPNEGDVWLMDKWGSFRQVGVALMRVGPLMPDIVLGMQDEEEGA